MAADRVHSAGQWQRARIAQRLGLAFAAVAGTTLLASVAAWITFSQVDHTVGGITRERFPITLKVGQLQAASRELSSDVSTLAAADSDDSRQHAMAALKVLLAHMHDDLAALAQRDNQSSQALTTALADLERRIGEADGMVAERLALAGMQQQQIDKARAAHHALIDALQPVKLAANADMLSAVRRISAGSGSALEHLIDKQFGDLQTMLTLRTELFKLEAVASDPQAGSDDGSKRQLAAIGSLLAKSPNTLAVAGADLQAGVHSALAMPDAAQRRQSVQRAVGRFDSALSPLIYRSTLEMVSSRAAINHDATNALVLLTSEQVASLLSIQRVESLANQMLGDISLVALAGDPEQVRALAREYRAARDAIDLELAAIHTATPLDGIRQYVALLGRQLADRDGLFRLKDQQLALAAASHRFVVETRQAAEGLIATASKISSDNSAQLDTAVLSLDGRLTRSRGLMGGLALLSVLFSFGLGYLYVGQRITRRLTRLAASTRGIVAGDLDTPIDTSGDDEISARAKLSACRCKPCWHWTRPRAMTTPCSAPA